MCAPIGAVCSLLHTSTRVHAHPHALVHARNHLSAPLSPLVPTAYSYTSPNSSSGSRRPRLRLPARARTALRPACSLCSTRLALPGLGPSMYAPVRSSILLSTLGSLGAPG